MSMSDRIKLLKLEYPDTNPETIFRIAFLEHKLDENQNMAVIGCIVVLLVGFAMGIGSGFNVAHALIPTPI
jgi:hypothetical protein